MSLTYVVPDIHGRLDLMNGALDGIAEHANRQAGTIIALGDYVDKGRESKAVIHRLRCGDVLQGWRLIFLKGNHDAMMVDALRDRSRLKFWLERGGDTALESYGGDPADVPSADVNWLAQLPLMQADRHRLYVHAGVDPDRPLDQQSERTLLWKRYPEDFQGGFGGRHVVHGHDSFVDGPKLYAGRTNLDTRAWKTGRLAIGVFDDEKPGGPIDLIKVTGPAFEPNVGRSTCRT
jgi:serine/threonine protein phosphatase 1